MTGTDQTLSIGARNPYALAELVQGSRINWRRRSYDSAMAKLENTFDMPADRLFDPRFDSPLYRRDVADLIRADTSSGLLDDLSSRQSMTLCIASDYQSYAGSFIAASGMQVFDPYQSGALKNCSLIAAMASCAWTGKGAWYKSVASEMLAGSYSLNFYDYNSAIGPVYPTSKLPQVPKGTLIYARSTTAGECWPSIIEKGYYMARDKLRQISSDTPDPEYYNDDSRNPTGVPATVLFQLLNTEPKKRSVLLNGTDYAKMIWPDLLSICIGRGSQLKIRYPAIAYSYPTSQAPITARHSYSILGLAGTYDATNGWTSKYIVLRDPWAVTTDPGFSSNEMLTSGAWVGGVDFAKKDGIFALRADLFPVYFQGYAYAVM